MHLSKTSKYAIKLLTHMVVNENTLYRSKDLCDTLDIPYKYLSAIITNLSKAGIINSSKGRNGGISFAKDINKITLQDIIEVTENSDIHECIMGFGACDTDKRCALHDTWKEPKQSIINDFLSQTLQDIKNSSKK